MPNKTKAPASKSASKIGITPLGDRVLVRPLTEDALRQAQGKKPSFGIILPDSVAKEKSGQGKVVAVGEGRFEDGKIIPIKVKVGDSVFFSKYSYDEVTLGDEEFYLLKEDNILAVLK